MSTWQKTKYKIKLFEITYLKCDLRKHDRLCFLPWAKWQSTPIPQLRIDLQQVHSHPGLKLARYIQQVNLSYSIRHDRRHHSQPCRVYTELQNPTS